ncbi:hypothetical protein ACPCAC_08505 [Streptomyces lavendulocolor]|uniref:hypothetical protein n=1 Tax=Streptomyces lavendulocolor TaxID=67316 RepID=UPI003C2C6C46
MPVAAAMASTVPRTQRRRWRPFEFVGPESGERLAGPDAEPEARTEERSEDAAPSVVR